MTRKRAWPRARLTIAALIALLGAGNAACSAWAELGRPREPVAVPRNVTGGVPAQGQDAIRRYGCGTCHQIPGVPGANGLVGPPLSDFAHRDYIAGQLVNTPDNLVLWIMDPQAVEPGTAMPALGVTLEDARDMAAYLYTR